jgi:hypothetical protein
MDLKQRKLNRSEWNSIEVSVSESEINVLQMIMAGYSNVNIRINKNHSILSFLKIEYCLKMEDQIYNKYLQEIIDKFEKELVKMDDKYKIMKIDSSNKLTSVNKIRLEKHDINSLKQNNVYEFILLDHIEKLMKYKKENNITKTHYHYFTLYKLIKNNISKLNRHIIEFTNKILKQFEEINISVIIENAVEFIERNEHLLKYDDLSLYEHQKEIFTICKLAKPKLILYIAPTGTGKTLTPIALSQEKKIIFVCAARHVGLALAKAAISVNKKIAFAFGCASADDIRLHYFAAKEFTRNKRSGGIGKVDNSVGDDVEIIICDIKSYLAAMYYMLAFNKAEDIIFYWDEPTITLDYEEHEFHKTIKKNWTDNLIPNIVLSSATLPKLHEITETTADYLIKFRDGEIFNIISHDCKKSIPIINKDGFVVVPHYLNDDYEEIVKIAIHCQEYMTILRYLDLKEVVDFIGYININNYANAKMNINRHFESLNEINMKNIKNYYIQLLQNIKKDSWKTIYHYFKMKQTPRIFENHTIDPKGNKNNLKKINSVGPGTGINTTYKNSSLSGTPITKLRSEQCVNDASVQKEPIGTSGVYITTKDAYTLTDGPTIFLSDEIEKIAKFCIQQANIPSIIMDEIMKKIDYNNTLNERLHTLETEIEYLKEKADKVMKNNVSDFHKGVKVNGRNKSSKDSKKINRDCGDEMESKGEIGKLTNEVNTLRSMIKVATLNDTFVPNKKLHLNKWAEGLDVSSSFTSNVDEHIVSDIMALKGVDDLWKILLMMGIGVFINHENITYTEIMKKLADEQKLYMIIASTDYIYGTNYQFCQGYISKSLNLTQEKIMQSMGRIGRSNIQQKYSIRFRDDSQILKLFTSETEKPEIINMNILFNSRNVILKDNEYIEVEVQETENELFTIEEDEEDEEMV